MDLSKVRHFRGAWTACVLADSHTRPSSRHKSQLWREILSMNAELSSALQPPPDRGASCRTGGNYKNPQRYLHVNGAAAKRRS